MHHRRYPILLHLFILAAFITSAARPLRADPTTTPDMSNMSPEQHTAMMAEHPQPTGSFLARLFETYVPRQMCMNYEPDVIWLHIISDTIIAISYYTIPLALIYFVRRRKDLAFNWMFVAFAAFILACGTTHLFSVIAIWRPYYRLDGVIKAFTALISIATAIALWKLIPQALAIPSPSSLRIANEKLQALTADLESRVQQRTSELEATNLSLRDQIGARLAAETAQVRLAAIVQCSNDAIIGKTLDGRITDWNAGAHSIFGYSPEEIIGQSILTIVAPERHDEERLILSRLGQGQTIEHFETLRIRKDGTPIHVSLTSSPIKDASGKIIGASTIARDITDRKRAETDREALLAREHAARKDAENASRLKDEFVATLSHELRTPVNAILGWTNVLRGKNVTQEEISDGLEIIERNTRVQVRLIEDLLDMSRILSGKLRLDLLQIQLADVINAAIETVRPAADAKGIRIQKTLDPLAAAIMGDPNRLQQVIWNLLANAVKFTPRGGRILIQLQRVNSHLEIVVTDSGVGIKPEFLPHVFERFRQQDASTTRQFGGLGLGLSIVRHLTELHGGTVSVQSDGENQGAAFTLAFPLPAVDSETSLDKLVDHDFVIPRFDGLKVLVIDDEPDARSLVKRQLETHGATVFTAGIASEAYASIRTDRPDVIICDIGMPGEDGYALIQKVRTWPADQGGTTPAVALTAFASADDRSRARLAGFQMHLTKPANVTELLAVVASLSGRLKPT